MAFTMGRRCSLCGGKLDGKLRCKECGLDNTKNDSMYKNLINKSNCDHEPLTHVHQHKETYQTKSAEPDLKALKERLQKKYMDKATERAKAYNYQPGKSSNVTGNTYSSRQAGNTATKKFSSKKSTSAKSKIGIIISVMFLAISLISSIFELVSSNIVDDEYAWEVVEEDWLDSDYYEYSTQLEEGFYTVGVHLPAGTYDIQLLWGDYVSIDFYQYKERYLYGTDFRFLEYGESQVIRNVELAEGMILKLSQYGGIELLSDSVDYDSVCGVDNPLPDSYYIQEEAVAGIDFPAGVYDICYFPEEQNYVYGCINYNIYDSGFQDFIISDSIYVDSDLGEVWYYNVPLTEGSVISLEEVQQVYLMPSLIVPPTIDQI